MSVETADSGALILVMIMALVTVATRWGGVYVMAFVQIGPRVEQFIAAMSSSVLVALLAPMAYQGDNAARLALLITAGAMLIIRKPLPAIAAGVVAAALFRQF
ncbi:MULTISPECIES: AzlD family protein [Pseudomonas]|uniref:AzlD domain-containing protein n=1 Tax=Pseudomonas saxonica TaxID=2600598 RepID=A0A5C5PZP7_9PSED|nr:MULTISPECIES: AzlD domain-containing protein [Pseudomonas]MCH4873001.1 AzlD domain-containing protein [Pseudomonas sp. TMW22091]TWR92078.1 AzlD domain-containing protein [Pseudomonas saxonica]TWR95261.1 AzlD domain-containing protein [Pseudomonas saxonica]